MTSRGCRYETVARGSLMDPVRITIALGPLAMYLVLIGWLNLSKRPFVTSGARDFLALAVALSGLVAVGPLELFMPEQAAAVMGGKIWIPLILLYLLVTSLISMVMKPRIIVYNMSADEIRPMVGSIVSELDHEARWAGDSVCLPNLRMQLYLQTHPAMRNAQLVATNGEQNLTSWKRLESQLYQAMNNVSVTMNPRAVLFFIAASIMIAVIGVSLLAGREVIAERMADFFRL
ncbi:MAG: hypothetical protein KDB27_29060 [Planctomycetales bacterium]|nr:hypothetical protein [Planctomycetales bacterium]